VPQRKPIFHCERSDFTGCCGLWLFRWNYTCCADVITR